ncbi:hypothetical protein BH11MYX4_BH11MYX4_11700 [soil metagenome]
MSNFDQRRFLAAVAVAAVLLAACSSADFNGDAFDTGAGAAPVTTKTDPNACVPGGGVALAPEDPSKYPKCACATKGGAARCIPKAKVPANVSSQLEACTEGGAGVCVPDPLVKSGGAAPPTCKSPFGEGRCMSLCVPEVAKNADLLGRGENDSCAADERCAPCLNPLKNNEPTGVCEIGKPVVACDPKAGTPAPSPAPSLACPYTGPPVVDVTKFPSCGDGARCVPASLVPASSAAMLKPCATGLCAPEKSIAAGGQYVPRTCAAVAGAEGRCLNVNISQVEAQKAQLTRDTCDASELCAPCFNPIDGKDTGACKSASCDAPKQPAKTFTACCSKHGTSRAKCVPKAIVPASQAGNLDDDGGTCAKDAELCVPNEMLQPNFKGPACTGSTFLTGGYTGVCLSDCLSFSFIEKLGISRGSCTDDFKCAPCTNPLTGKATGAPGCPGT